VSNHRLLCAAGNVLGGRWEWGTGVNSNVLLLTQYPSTQISIFNGCGFITGGFFFSASSNPVALRCGSAF